MTTGRHFEGSQGGERGCHGAVVADKATVKVCKPQEMLKLFAVFRNRPESDSTDFG